MSFCQVVFAQLSANAELGAGVQVNGNDNLFWDFRVAGGYSIKNLAVYGGFKLDFHNVKYYDFGGHHQNTDDETSNILNFSFLTGARYYINLFNDISSGIDHLGVFPEYNFYYTPFLSNRITYYDKNEQLVTSSGGGVQSHIAHGYGFGVFFGNKDEGVLTIKGEFNTLNPFKVLNTLSYEKENFQFAGPVQYILSIGYYYIH